MAVLFHCSDVFSCSEYIIWEYNTKISNEYHFLCHGIWQLCTVLCEHSVAHAVTAVESHETITHVHTHGTGRVRGIYCIVTQMTAHVANWFPFSLHTHFHFASICLTVFASFFAQAPLLDCHNILRKVVESSLNVFLLDSIWMHPIFSWAVMAEQSKGVIGPIVFTAYLFRCLLSYFD